MSTRPPSLQRRLLITLTGAIVALFGIGALGIYVFMRHSLYEQMDRHMERTAEDFIAETHRNPDGTVESGFHDLKLEDFGPKESSSTAFYELRDSTGNSILRSPSLGDTGSLPYEEVEQNGHKTASIPLPDGTPGRVIYAPFPLRLEKTDPGDAAEVAARTPEQITYLENYDESAPHNRALLSIAESLSPLRNTLAILATTLLVTGVLLAFATFLIIHRIVAVACRPVSELSEMTETMGPDSVDRSLPCDGVPEEMRPLIVKFNELIARLDTAIRREKRFSMDIAHELRTPVAEMRTLLEVAAGGDGVDDDDPHEIYRTGAAISQRMSGILEVLTTLHHDGSGAVNVKFEPTDLHAIAEASAHQFDLQERERISFSEPEKSKVLVKSDPRLLRAVIDNLIGNALAHSPLDSPISIDCKDSSISIRNEVAGLSEADLPRLQEPFWQKDPSRTDANKFGLGLTLVGVYLRLLEAEIELALVGDFFFAKVTLPPTKSGKQSAQGESRETEHLSVSI